MLSATSWGLRYASHLGFRSPDAPLFRHTVGSSDAGAHVRFAASLGFAGVQFAWALSREPLAIESFRQAAIETSLEGSCVVCAPFEEFKQPLWGLDSRFAHAVIERQVRRACEMARLIRSRTVAVVATAEPTEERALQVEHFIDNLRRASVISEEYGITLVVETMRTVPNMLLANYDELHEIVARCDRRNVRMIFDTFHVHALHSGEDLLACFERWYDLIALLQLADHPAKVEPGAGMLDFVGVLAGAMRRGFGGLVELEHLWLTEGLEGETQGLERLRRIDSLARVQASETTA